MTRRRLGLLVLALLTTALAVGPDAQVLIQRGLGPTFTGILTTTVDNVGSTSTDGMVLRNTTPAAAGAQQFSPRTCWTGNGWRTNATAQSETVTFCLETQPVQGSADPTGQLILKYSINGAAFTTLTTFSTLGNFVSTPTVFSGASGNAGFRSSGEGVMQLLNGSLNDFTRLQFGGSTTSFNGLTPVRATSVPQGFILGLADGTGQTFANLGAATNGSQIYCSDCQFANPCASGGTGAIAKRLNGAWRCD